MLVCFTSRQHAGVPTGLSQRESTEREECGRWLLERERKTVGVLGEFVPQSHIHSGESAEPNLFRCFLSHSDQYGELGVKERGRERENNEARRGGHTGGSCWVGVRTRRDGGGGRWQLGVAL